MSRSFRKRPYGSYCGSDSQKEWKQMYNRMMRRNNRVLLSTKGEDAVFYLVPEIMDVWAMPRDGKRWYAPYEGERKRYPTWIVLTYREWYRWVKAK